MRELEDLVEDLVAAVEDLHLAYPPCGRGDELAIHEEFTGQLIVVSQKFAADALALGILVALVAPLGGNNSEKKHSRGSIEAVGSQERMTSRQQQRLT